MSDATAALIARIRAGREHWLELDDRHAVKWRIPSWEEQGRMMLGRMEQMRVAVGLVIDWRGFVESDFVPGVASKPLEFSPELWDAALVDHIDWVPKLMRASIDGIAARADAQKAASGN